MEVNRMSKVQKKTLELWNIMIQKKSAIERIEWSIDNLPNNKVMTSSFGIQSSVMLHMISQISPNIPVILADTGYLFPETYRYMEELTHQLQLNLHICKAELSAKAQIIKYGKLWEQGQQGMDQHYYLNKIEPFERAMSDLNAQTWFSGIRAEQSQHRTKSNVVEQLRNHIKVHPIIDWTNADIHSYIKKNGLPSHPLQIKGYQSVGDIHNTQSRSNQLMNKTKKPYGGKRECGLHTFTL
jgi:phosphoadenosine phosphosulfate reductase